MYFILNVIEFSPNEITLTYMIEPFLIAEIGCNHKGDISVAKEMIDVAALFCKVDAVKFQKRNPRELLGPNRYNAPHPNPSHSYGETYGAHREFLEFTIEQHSELKDHCEKRGIIYSTSVWDMTSAREIAALNPQFVKIPSATNLNTQILDFLCEQYSGEIQISIGMTTHAEEAAIVERFLQHGRAKDLTLFSCTSGYPVAFEDICLFEITRLKALFETKVKRIGFSGHHLGIAADIAGLALGAEVFERHFTLDRTWKGTDHAASLEPDGMRRLARDLRNVAKALSFKRQEILPVEAIQREKLKISKP